MSTVTVVMPTYNSEKYITDAIRSVQKQTWTDWNMLVINEYGSNDATIDIIRDFQSTDSRIVLVQNEEKLGLGASLNLGLRMAEGKYIARLDADDIAHPTRFEKQVLFMEKNPSIAICGTWQRHFGADIDWVHQAATSAEQCKANLLFFCDLCHSTLMLRKDFFHQHDLEYNNQYLAEDFELWTRVIRYGNIVNLPEILGEYRCTNDNITLSKKDQLHSESGLLVSKSLKNNLGITLSPDEITCLCNWHNPIEDAVDKAEFLQRCEIVLKKIYFANSINQFYDPQCLLNAISAKWRWIRYYEPFTLLKHAESIDSIFLYRPKSKFLSRLYYFLKYNKGIKGKIKKIYQKSKKIFITFK